MRWALAILLAALAGPAAAADVVSAGPEGVELLIYRDRPVLTSDLDSEDDTAGLALVTESRTVDLPAGESRIRFLGVADGVIPQSASVEGLPARQRERNFDYDLLGPGSLIAAMVDKPVTVVRTNPKTGKEERETATLRSGPDGIVLEGSGGVEALHCGAGPERLEFDHAPEGLADRPTLSVLTNVAQAGRYKLRLSYLTVRIDWSADYIARVTPDGKSLNLSGWITVANRTGVSFENAPTAVVAGKLARAPVDLPAIATQSVALSCWPGQTTHSGWRFPIMVSGYADKALAPPPPLAIAGAPLAEVIVTAQKRQEVVAQELGDYKLYALPEPTTVAARQTKQLQFIDRPNVKFDTVYAYRAWYFPSDAPSQPQPTRVTFRLENKKADGLGLPLPAGMVSVRLTGDGREHFAGEHGVRDVPMGEPFEIETGNATDVFVQQRVVSDQEAGPADRRREAVTYEVVATNAKNIAAPVEIRQTAMQGFRVEAENVRHALKAGEPVWRFTLPAGGSRTLRYTFSYDE